MSFTAMNWEGTYVDSIYGGNINVCVTLIDSGAYIGQALFSQVGYMRGPIDPNNLQWTGDFFTAGQEAKQGSFALNLNSLDSSIDGWFMEKAGLGINYTFSSTQLSSLTPSNLECFRTDASYLSSVPPAYTYSGLYNVGYDCENYYDADADEVYGSYTYYYQDDDNNGQGFRGEIYHDVSVLFVNSEAVCLNVIRWLRQQCWSVFDPLAFYMVSVHLFYFTVHIHIHFYI